MLRPWLSSLVLLAALLLVCPVGAQAGQSARRPDGHLWAVLEGQPIRLVNVGRYHCHDFAFPLYTCFTTAGERNRDVAEVLAARTLRRPGLGTINSPLGTQSVDYVLFYEHSAYAGASALVSIPVPDLSVLGWNNRISSFKSTNGGRPKWWDGTSYSGLNWQWGVSVWVSYVGDGANDRFTSVQNVP
jgi:hypothetical protein